MTTKKKNKKLVVKIPRKRWLAPDGYKELANSALYDKILDAGCCLGHVIHTKSRCSWNDLDGIGLPYQYYDRADSLLTVTGFDELEDSYLSNKASAINDNKGFTRKEKEQKLKELFKPYNVQLVFTGEEDPRYKETK